MEIFLGAFTAEWEQRKAAFLHDLTLGRRTLPEEDERRRRGGVVAPKGPAGVVKSSGLRVSEGRGRSSGRRPTACRPAHARTLCRARLGEPTGRR